MQTIALTVPETARVTLLAPEAIASLGVLHPPATDVPLGLVLERQFLAALAAHLIAAVLIRSKTSCQKIRSSTLTDIIDCLSRDVQHIVALNRRGDTID